MRKLRPGRWAQARAVPGPRASARQRPRRLGRAAQRRAHWPTRLAAGAVRGAGRRSHGCTTPEHLLERRELVLQLVAQLGVFVVPTLALRREAMAREGLVFLELQPSARHDRLDMRACHVVGVFVFAQLDTECVDRGVLRCSVVLATIYIV